MKALARRTSRGFTLTELMIVVSMIGVLSALALVGYKKYVDSAKNNEAISVIQSIRSAEEEFRDKTLTYFNVSTAGTYYPRDKSTVDSKKASWQKAANDAQGARWATLGVNVSGPVAFTYKVNSGLAGTAINIPGGIDYSPAPSFTTPTKDWYIVQAYGDPNENGKPTVFLSTSFSNDIAYNEDQLKTDSRIPSRESNLPSPHRPQESIIMRTFRSFKARGFTLVELMIVVAIIGVLAALAIYGVRRYLATAKSSEAKNTIGAINRGALAAYERESVSSEAVTEGSTSKAATHALCNTSSSVPAAVTSVKGVKYQPDTSKDKDYNSGTPQSGWPCLRFSMSDPQYYQYTYTKAAAGTNASGGTIATPTANGWQSAAVGDLDGDGILSAFATGGELNSSTGEAKAFSQVGENQPDELSASPMVMS